MKRFLLILIMILSAATAYGRYVAVSWNPVAGATAYKLYWGPTSGGPYPYTFNVGNVTSYQPAINEETTFMVVAAIDGTGEGPVSTETVFANAYNVDTTTLLQDGPSTPEQISIFLPGTYPTTMTASMRYRKVGAAWITGHDLYRIPGTENEPGFAWVVTDLDQGSTYNVEVTTSDGGVTQKYSKTMTTSSLAPAAGAVTKTISAGASSATINGVLATAVPGDVIQFANGTYSVDAIKISKDGTESQPIYIRGESRDGVVLHDPTGTVFHFDTASYVVLENMTLQGSGVDAGIAPASTGIVYWGGYGGHTIAGNITLRHLTIKGVDKGIISSTYSKQMMIYENILEGNNSWAQDFYASSGSGAPGAGDGIPDIDQNIFWNDDGIYLGGLGNGAFNNTLTGFGDTLATQGGSPSAGIHFYRNKILMSGDDCFEADYGRRNITFYDNHSTNSMTLVSADPITDGPVIAFRNVGINIGRQAFKLNSDSQQGMFFYNNTIVNTKPTVASGSYNDWVMVNYKKVGVEDIGFQNNITVRQNAPVGIGLLAFQLEPVRRVDWTHNSWFPDGRVWWTAVDGTNTSLANAYTNLPLTTPIFSGATKRHEADVISEAQPFVTPIVLGEDFFTKVTTTYIPTLSSGGVSKNSGTQIRGVTDGFTGAAPDRGAIIAGRSMPVYGASGESAPVCVPTNGGVEICGDGIDQDCNGSDLACPVVPGFGRVRLGTVGAPGVSPVRFSAPGPGVGKMRLQ